MASRQVIARAAVTSVILAFSYGSLTEALTAPNVGALINGLLRPLILIALVWLSTPAKKVLFGPIELTGLVLSFGAVLLFGAEAVVHPQPVWLLFYINSLYLSVLLIASYGSLGSNFGIVPAIRSVTTGALYSLVRHPIYSCCLHLAFQFLLVFPTLSNLVAMVFLGLGIWLRISSEERLLQEGPDYLVYQEKVTNRLFHPILSFPVAVLLAAGLLSGRSLQGLDARAPVSIQMAYPVLSLSPADYDDWGSVFVGNHIYPRLTPDKERPWLPSIADRVAINCIDGSECRIKEVRFEVQSMQACSGRWLNAEVVKMELQELLEKRTWVLPGWQFCPAQGQEICLRVAGRIEDLERRLQNIYFRFGWSLNDSAKLRYGVGPYCLTPTKFTGGVVMEGVLIPSATTTENLPKIDFVTSLSNSTEFDVALYGTRELLNDQRTNLETHTPLAYYVISNSRHRAAAFAWNHPETAAILRSYLGSEGVISPDGSSFRLMPDGAALNGGMSPEKSRNREQAQAVFHLPDYLPNCGQLAERLNADWVRLGFNGQRAACGDLGEFITQSIFEKKNEWFGFLTPLSAGAPSRSAVADQYFSPQSRDSWTGDASEPQNYYYLVGTGSMPITVRSTRFCSVAPNSLGLGDLIITDLKSCP